jgi:beta-galactosidase
VVACDKYGVAIVCPAGDKERDATGRQWDQRVEVMRDSMIFFRNNPSILFWEAGNTGVTPIKCSRWSPCASNWIRTAAASRGMRRLRRPLTRLRVLRRDDRPGPQTDQLRHHANVSRLQRGTPRQGAADRDGGFPRRGRARHLGRLFAAALRLQTQRRTRRARPRAGQDTYHWNSETFALAAATRYARYGRNRIDNPDPAHSKWAAYASIYFTDSDADGRQDGSEVLRVSGKMDGVRLPKELYFVSRVMQSDTPDMHIIGHWTYPANTVKTVYVAASFATRSNCS